MPKGSPRTRISPNRVLPAPSPKNLGYFAAPCVQGLGRRAPSVNTPFPDRSGDQLDLKSDFLIRGPLRREQSPRTVSLHVVVFDAIVRCRPVHVSRAGPAAGREWRHGPCRKFVDDTGAQGRPASRSPKV